jgi:hypothetical protein
MILLLPVIEANGQRRKDGRAMPGSSRIHKLSQEQQSKAANHSVRIERRTHPVVREPLNPIEDAMDVAIGGEGKPWVERRKAA